MRVLYLLERYPELSQTFVAQELAGLLELGVDVRVGAIRPGSPGFAPVEAIHMDSIGPAGRLGSAVGAALHRPMAVGRMLTTEHSWPPPGGTDRLRGLTRLAPLVPHARSADHLHAHFATEATDIARLLSRLSGTPFSFTAHATDAYGPVWDLALNLQEARFARACSAHVADRLVAASPGSAAKVFQLGVAIDFAKFSRAGAYRPDGPLVAVGRLVEKKGFDDLIEAFAALPAERLGRGLRIVGEGPQRPVLESLIRSTGAPVELLGALDNDSVARELSDASAFVLTPRTAADGDRDGRPAAIAEAMASGLPIVSTAQPGIPELVSAECGLLADPGDPGSITAALARMLETDPSKRAAMGERGRARALELHSRESVARSLAARFDAEAEPQDPSGPPTLLLTRD